MKRIGILGGGQLGMLLAQSIVRLGAEALVYDPDPQAPACRAVKSSVNAKWDDKEALSRFLSSCDVVTYEFENIPYDCLAVLNHSTPIFPSLEVLKLTQNRAQEKQFLHNHGLPHVPYIILENVADLKAQVDHLKFPIILKSTIGGYDGKSQFYVKAKSDLEKILFQGDSIVQLLFPMIAERAISLHMETSCIIARNRKGEQVSFPPFENVHCNHILDTTVIPANLSEKLANIMQELASKAAVKLGVVGLLCVEFFISHRNEVVKSAVSVEEFDLYINEFAPRPHNSGHVTISGCTLSQFDALARILLDVPLAVPKLSSNGYFCMANLLGDIWLAQGTEEGDRLNLTGLNNQKELVELIIYGKKEARQGRKMGHLVTYALQAEKALMAAKSMRTLLMKRPYENE